MQRICAEPGCRVAAGRVRCQDCGKAFCGGHIGAVEFSGPRAAGAHPTDWTRYICAVCARRATRITTAATAKAAHDQAWQEQPDYRWVKR